MKAFKRPSIPLPDDEVILLHGGLRPLGWVWIVPSLLFAIYTVLMAVLLVAANATQTLEGDRWAFFGDLVCLLLWPIPLALWPWLLSGTYWLTTRRVIWKPRIGKAVGLSLAEIDLERIRAGALTHSLHLRGARPLTLRFIHRIEQVWGGILLLRTPGIADAVERAAQEPAEPAAQEPAEPTAQEPAEPAALVWTATWTQGIHYQYGQAVLRRDDLAFIPWYPQFNAWAQLAKQATYAILSLAAPVRPRLPLEPILIHLIHLPETALDPVIETLVQSHDGTRWKRHALQVARKQATARRFILNFYAADATIGGYIQQDQAPLADHLLSLWDGYQDGGPV